MADRLIKISSRRISKGEFVVVSDEYLTRPAKEDFWRIEVGDDGNSVVVSRLVDDKHGNPEVFETPIQKQASRKIQLASGEYPVYMALSADDKPVLLNDAGDKVDANKVDLSGIESTFLQPLIYKMQKILTNINLSKNDTNWIKELVEYKKFLADEGPVNLNPEDPSFKKMTPIIDKLYRASNG